jgi:D-beta-D-heptose 7-phosphate kinase/D-beta-D-heptose 1-phosphate adenosyltransferase
MSKVIINETFDILHPKQLNILLLGDDCLDVYQFGSVDRISPEAPVPVFKKSHSLRRSGMARNVCENLEALGCKVNYLHGQPSIKTRLIDSRSKQQIVRIDEDAFSNPITFDTADLLTYDAVVVSDYEKGAVSYDLVKEIIKSAICPVFIDTKKTDLSVFNGAYIKINQLEASRTISTPDPEWLITTMGAQGVCYNGYTFPAETVEVADVCGAGDTFLASLVYQYLNTNDMHKSINFAMKASSITVQHLGCYSPTLEEINV